METPKYCIFWMYFNRISHMVQLKYRNNKGNNNNNNNTQFFGISVFMHIVKNTYPGTTCLLLSRNNLSIPIMRCNVFLCDSKYLWRYHFNIGVQNFNFILSYCLEELRLSSRYFSELSDSWCSRHSSRKQTGRILCSAWHWIFRTNSSISELRIVW